MSGRPTCSGKPPSTKRGEAAQRQGGVSRSIPLPQTALCAASPLSEEGAFSNSANQSSVHVSTFQKIPTPWWPITVSVSMPCSRLVAT